MSRPHLRHRRASRFPGCEFGRAGLYPDATSGAGLCCTRWRCWERQHEHGTGPGTISVGVRGTSDTTHVYFLQSGSRRPIPDEATLNFMLAGQTVRVLSDAALAAIPLGAVLPTPSPTTRFTTARPGRSHTSSPSGQKRAFPNATTLRDAGHDVSTLLPISDADAGPAHSRRVRFLFPDTEPLPHAAICGHPPGPSALVRLETRFQGGELWLRVYPDDVHINSFEPQLSSAKNSAGAAYLWQRKPVRTQRRSRSEGWRGSTVRDVRGLDRELECSRGSEISAIGRLRCSPTCCPNVGSSSAIRVMPPGRCSSWGRRSRTACR